MKRCLQPSPPSAQQSHRDNHVPDLLRQVDVCARLGISDETWMRWRKAGRAPEPVQLPSGRLKWRREDIDALAGVVRERAPRRQYFQSARRHSRATVAAFASERPGKSAARKFVGGGR